MNVTRDVVKDLLTVYLAGEASPDTRALVEEYLKTDAALAREVAQATSADLSLPPTPPQAGEKQVLDAIRQQLKVRTYTMAGAIVFSLMPLTSVRRGGEMTFSLIRDAPTIGIALWVTAAVMWVWHWRVRVRLRVSGL